MYNSDVKTSSRSSTPWDSFEDAELDPIECYLKHKYHKHFDSHHIRISDTDEAEFLNSIPVKYCHHCGSDQIIRWGHKGRLNRYYCKQCRRTFVITTNTIFDNHKLTIEEWIEYCLNLFSYGSTNLVSKANKNSITTARYWLLKVFSLLKEYQNDIQLSGKIYLDETYYKKRNPDVVKKQNDKEYRGLSKNQECIFTAIDEDGHIVAIVNGTGKPSQQRCWNALGNHIKPGSYLVHDKERAHKILIRSLNLDDEVHDSKECIRLSNDENPLQPVNDLHKMIKAFLNTHSGFDRSHLQDYLNLFVFIYNGRENQLSRVYDLVKMGLSKPISLKYRDVFLPRHEY